MSYFVIEPPSPNITIFRPTFEEAKAAIDRESAAGGDVREWAVAHWEDNRLVVDWRGDTAMESEYQPETTPEVPDGEDAPSEAPQVEPATEPAEPEGEDETEEEETPA